MIDVFRAFLLIGFKGANSNETIISTTRRNKFYHSRPLCIFPPSPRRPTVIPRGLTQITDDVVLLVVSYMAINFLSLLRDVFVAIRSSFHLFLHPFANGSASFGLRAIIPSPRPSGEFNSCGCQRGIFQGHTPLWSCPVGRAKKFKVLF